MWSLYSTPLIMGKELHQDLDVDLETEGCRLTSKSEKYTTLWAKRKAAGLLGLTLPLG